MTITTLFHVFWTTEQNIWLTRKVPFQSSFDLFNAILMTKEQQLKHGHLKSRLYDHHFHQTKKVFTCLMNQTYFYLPNILSTDVNHIFTKKFMNIILNIHFFSFLNSYTFFFFHHHLYCCDHFTNVFFAVPHLSVTVQGARNHQSLARNQWTRRRGPGELRKVGHFFASLFGYMDFILYCSILVGHVRMTCLLVFDKIFQQLQIWTVPVWFTGVKTRGIHQRSHRLVKDVGNGFHQRTQCLKAKYEPLQNNGLASWLKIHLEAIQNNGLFVNVPINNGLYKMSIQKIPEKFTIDSHVTPPAVVAARSKPQSTDAPSGTPPRCKCWPPTFHQPKVGMFLVDILFDDFFWWCHFCPFLFLDLPCDSIKWDF